MLKPHLFLKPTRETTRLYLTLGGRELLRAVLPPPGPSLHPRSAPTLLEGLALWLQRPVSVVLCAADEDDSSALGLSDGFGLRLSERALRRGGRGSHAARTRSRLIR
jgi:hypothetical protein